MFRDLKLETLQMVNGGASPTRDDGGESGSSNKPITVKIPDYTPETKIPGGPAITFRP